MNTGHRNWQCGIAALKGNQILGLITKNITHKENESI